MIGRRSFITGLVSLVAAPAIVRAGSLMPVRVMVERVDPHAVPRLWTASNGMTIEKIIEAKRLFLRWDLWESE